MPVTHQAIRDTVARYVKRWPEESRTLAPLTGALAAGSILDCRTDYSAGGHITCGAAVLNTSGRVLFVLNRNLGRWLLPGGHLEPRDSSLHRAALRELTEETDIAIMDIADFSNPECPLDIGLHAIPANPSLGEPRHWHADFRFGFLVQNPKVQLQSSEVGGYEWRSRTDDVIPGFADKLRPFVLSVLSSDCVISVDRR